MKQFVTIVAFSVTSLVSVDRRINPTAISDISEAPTVRVFFDSNADDQYLSTIQSELAKRDIQLDYQDVRYDSDGKLAAISFAAQCPDRRTVETSVDVSDSQGAYLYISFPEEGLG
jgi:predicted GTPase